MTFDNEKKTFFQKYDKSKKGDIDEKIKPLLDVINANPDRYSTSSCSGRAYLWIGSGKKNETTWIRVSHEAIDESFLNFNEPEIRSFSKGVVWLRFEGMILHVACRDLEVANEFLERVRRRYKKSCLLSIQNKIMVEVRGSEFLEMPLYIGGKLVFCGDKEWLVELINKKLEKNWAKMDMFCKEIKNRK